MDHVLEARTDWEHFSIRRKGHHSAVRPYPISVAWDESEPSADAGLQAADLVAYETFRLMHGKRSGVTPIRQALNSMLDTTGFIGYQFGQETLERIKDDVDSTECIPDGLIIVPPPLMERTVAKE